MYPYMLFGGSPLPAVGAASVFILIILGVSRAIKKTREKWRRLPEFPVMGKPGDCDMSQAIVEGYKKVCWLPLRNNLVWFPSAL
jgi:hypothetical protein